MIFLKGVITIFCDNAGISHNRVTEPLETLFHYDINGVQGPVARSLVSANRWLRGIKMYRFPWYLTLVSTNHASSNPGQKVIRQLGLTTGYCEI